MTVAQLLYLNLYIEKETYKEANLRHFIEHTVVEDVISTVFLGHSYQQWLAKQLCCHMFVVIVTLPHSENIPHTINVGTSIIRLITPDLMLMILLYIAIYQYYPFKLIIY